jgi:hypothetical protein
MLSSLRNYIGFFWSNSGKNAKHKYLQMQKHQIFFEWKALVVFIDVIY